MYVQIQLKNRETFTFLTGVEIKKMDVVGLKATHMLPNDSNYT